MLVVFPAVLDVISNLMILDITHINCAKFLQLLFTCCMDRDKKAAKHKYSASKELFFAEALERNLLFLEPSRGGTF